MNQDQAIEQVVGMLQSNANAVVADAKEMLGELGSVELYPIDFKAQATTMLNDAITEMAFERVRKRLQGYESSIPPPPPPAWQK